MSLLDERIAALIRCLADLRDEKKQLQKQMKSNRQDTARYRAYLKDLQAKKEAESK
jgi:predicted  nucleic acid-binding Zn-ribbon protein